MKIKTEFWEVMDAVAYFIVSLISLVLTVALFWQLHYFILFQIVWGLFGFSVEVTKHTVWYKIKKKKKAKERTTHLRVLHGIIVLISMTASFGFIKMSILDQSDVASKPKEIIEQQDSNIDLISEYMNTITSSSKANADEKTKMSNDEDIYYSGQVKIDDTTKSNTEAFLGLFDKLKTEQLEKIATANEVNSIVSATDVFDAIGSGIISGKAVQMILFLTLLAVLEIMICFTSLDIEEKKGVDPTFLKNITIYINALMDISGIRLNGDDKIEEMTSLTISECKKFKEYLLNTSVNGKPLISSGRGGSKANFSREAMINIVRNKVSIH